VLWRIGLKKVGVAISPLLVVLVGLGGLVVASPSLVQLLWLI
jgi:hypothetical protein